MQLLFQLGREPNLSKAEIFAIFQQKHISFDILSLEKDLLLLETDHTVSATDLMRRLAGVVKISERLFEHEASVLGIATYLFIAVPEGKIEFSLSGSGVGKTALQVKKMLKERGRSVRYIEPKNTATILHNKLVEKKTDLTLFKNALFVTRAIQPIEELSERDFGRPGFDAKSGMLPPKLARMMINLSGAKPTDTLLDPFCGSGTVLTEALHLGIHRIVGSDASEKAVSDTKQNIVWTKEQFHISGVEAEVIVAKAEALKEYLKPNSIDVLVSEPYLGKPLKGNESAAFLQKQVEDLRQLYFAAFSSFASILKPGGKVVFVIPQFRVNGSWLMIDCVEEIQQLGFTLSPLLDTDPSLLYWRPDQLVGRGVWRFVRE